MTWKLGGIWEHEFSIATSDLPLEYKYAVVKQEPVAMDSPLSSPREGEKSTNEESIKLTAKWEDTPNRVLKKDRTIWSIRDQWDQPQKTEAGLVKEDRNTILADIKSLETLIFPGFTYISRPIGNQEIGIAVVGSPDEVVTQGLPVKHRDVMIKGILKKRLDKKYEIFWFGKQNFESHVKGHYRINLSQSLPFDVKTVTFDDQTALTIKESNAMTMISPTNPVPNFAHVLANLGGSGSQINQILLWNPAKHLWEFIEAENLERINKRKSHELKISTKNSQDSSQSVRIPSQNGISAFQRIPGESDVVYIRSYRSGKDALTYISVLDEKGNVLLPTSYIGPFTYEGMMMVKDKDASKTEQFIATAGFETSALRIKEAQLRQSVEKAQLKFQEFENKEKDETQKSTFF
jgi:hypothetical protein